MIDRGAAPRFYQEEQPLAPLEITTPALGWDFVSREAPVQAARPDRHRRARRRPGPRAEPGQAGEAPAPPAAAPVATEQPVPESTPALDPVLAGAVITLTGALALHTARSNGRRPPLADLLARSLTTAQALPKPAGTGSATTGCLSSFRAPGASPADDHRVFSAPDLP